MKQSEPLVESPISPIWQRARNKTTGRSESDEAYAAFLRYRGLSPASRSCYSTALLTQREEEPQALEPSAQLVKRYERWSSVWHWVDRAIAWDDEQDRLECEVRRKRSEQVAKRHLFDNEAAQMCLHLDIQGMVEAIKQDPILSELSDAELARVVNKAIRVLPRMQAEERRLCALPKGPRLRGPELIQDDDLRFDFVQDEADRAASVAAMKQFDSNTKSECVDPETGRKWTLSGSGAQLEPEEDESESGEPLWARRAHPRTGKLETAREFYWFVQYRNLPPSMRTLAEITAQMRREKGVVVEAEKSPGGATRRREKVSERVETMAATWSWRMRARAWDDEQERNQRRALQGEIRQLRERQQKRVEEANIGVRMLLAVKLKRAHSKSQQPLTLSQKIRQGGAALGMVVKMNEADRAVRGNQEEVRERQVQHLSGWQFAWVQSLCECGHPYSDHDGRHPDRKLFPCTAAGCDCQKFQEAYQDEFEKKNKDRHKPPKDLVFDDD